MTDDAGPFYVVEMPSKPEQEHATNSSKFDSHEDAVTRVKAKANPYFPVGYFRIASDGLEGATGGPAA